MSGNTVASIREFSAYLALGITAVHEQMLPQHPQMFNDWLAIKTAVEWEQDEINISGFGVMPEKTVGGPIQLDKPVSGTAKTGELKSYALGFTATHELVKWLKYNIQVFLKTTNKLRLSGIYTRNILAYGILNEAFVPTDNDHKIYNGEDLCKTSHVLLRGISAGKNEPTSATGLSYLGIQQGINDFRTIRNEDGQFVMLMPKRLITHPNLCWVAEELLRTGHRPDNANEAHNSLSGLEVHDSPFLDSTTAWFLTCDKKTLADSISFHKGEDLSARHDFDSSTWDNTVNMYQSCRIWVQTWHGIWGTTG